MWQISFCLYKLFIALKIGKASVKTGRRRFSGTRPLAYASVTAGESKALATTADPKYCLGEWMEFEMNAGNRSIRLRLPWELMRPAQVRSARCSLGGEQRTARFRWPKRYSNEIYLKYNGQFCKQKTLWARQWRIIYIEAANRDKYRTNFILGSKS